MERIRTARVNDVFLPGCWLPLNVRATSELGLALENAETVLGVMPSRHARGLYGAMLPYLRPDVRQQTKGLEPGTLLRMSEVASEVVSAKFSPRIAALARPLPGKWREASRPR